MGQCRGNAFEARLLMLIDMNEPSVDDPFVEHFNRTDMTLEDFGPEAAGDPTEITRSKC